MRTHVDDFRLALSLIKELRSALSQADAAATEVNRFLIQRATVILEKHGADDLLFSD